MSTTERHVRLFRNGRNQVLRIPREFEMPGNEVTIIKDGERLIVQPVKRAKPLSKLLASWEPLEEEFPEIEDSPVTPKDMF